LLNYICYLWFPDRGVNFYNLCLCLKRSELWILGPSLLIWSQDFRGRGRPWGILFGFYKTRHILLSDIANCIVLRAVVLTQYRRVADGQTDGQTDGIAIVVQRAAMLF